MEQKKRIIHFSLKSVKTASAVSPSKLIDLSLNEGMISLHL
jgi:hypothetical protein